MKQAKSLFYTPKLYLQVGILSIAMGCSHAISPVHLASNSNPSVEVSNQRDQINHAIDEQVDVISPTHFKESNEYLAKAQEENAKGASNKSILKLIGYSKAHLNKAYEESRTTRSNHELILSARRAAMNAGARSYPTELNSLDSSFKRMTSKSDQSSAADREKLKNDYLALELTATQNNYLNDTKEILSQAEKKGAMRITPYAYKQAVQKYNVANTIIKTDRHNSIIIETAVADANRSAKRVLALLESEQISRNQTPEQRAVNLEARENALRRADKKNAQAESELTGKDARIAEQRQHMANVQEENNDLRKNEAQDQMVANAAAKFSKSEADVYRQKGNMIIRLKKMNFASGRSDLPSSSLEMLTKIKDIIKTIGPGAVMVQGHTDAVGGAQVNQTLSEERAHSVAQFFTADKELVDNKIESKGYGYTQPLASNKSSTGRAQNRRVDIIITPNQTH